MRGPNDLSSINAHQIAADDISYKDTLASYLTTVATFRGPTQ